jgi:hypothetical protein
MPSAFSAAKDCEELAKLVITDEARQKILKIAAGWRELADPSEPRLASRRQRRI